MTFPMLLGPSSVPIGKGVKNKGMEKGGKWKNNNEWPILMSDL